MLAVIEPCWPVVRSLMTTLKPAAVSFIWTVSTSPEFMNRSLAKLIISLLGFKGSAGSVATPLLVMKAKLTGSGPTSLRQFLLLSMWWF